MKVGNLSPPHFESKGGVKRTLRCSLIILKRDKVVRREGSLFHSLSLFFTLWKQFSKMQLELALRTYDTPACIVILAGSSSLKFLSFVIWIHRPSVPPACTVSMQRPSTLGQAHMAKMWSVWISILVECYTDRFKSSWVFIRIFMGFIKK